MMNTSDRRSRSVMFGAVMSLYILVFIATALSAQVPVRHQEGLVHGFLALRTLQGETLADGDLIQNVRGDRVTSRLVFHFKDGSLHDEVAIFSQRGQFRLLSDHLIQKGPAFPHPIDFTINGRTGEVTARYQEDGKEKTDTKQLHLPPDVANGVLLTLLKNVSPGATQTNVAYVAPNSKPRLVKLVITPHGEEQFSTAGAHRNAMHYVVKVDIGGLTGAFAELLGKQPADIHIWILEGEAPAFVKSEGPLAFGGPVWRIELVSPVWPSTADSESKK
jgi:hypothetical protein